MQAQTEAIGTTPSPPAPAFDSATLAAWGTALITLIGILVALYGVWWQVRKQRLMNSAAMITGLADRFTSEEWRSYRIHCASAIAARRRGEEFDLSKDFPVLGFFENIGHLVRRRVLDREMIWNKFGWYIIRYHIALSAGQSLIEQNRASEGDTTLWEEFDWLNGEMLRIYRKRGISIGQSTWDARIDELLRQESHLNDLADPAQPAKILLPGTRAR